MARQLQRLFARLKLSDKGAITTGDLTKVFYNSNLFKISKSMFYISNLKFVYISNLKLSDVGAIKTGA